MQRSKTTQAMAIAAILIYNAVNTVFAADAPSEKKEGKDDATRLAPVTVENGKILEGKKVTVTESAATPPVVNNNLRQAFTQKPGLLVSEQNTPGHVNLNYRGIGDPHESEFVLTLKDGIPIVLDWFGYPTVYYGPALESIERIEFIRGGSALLYGPQPGPALNYVTHNPPRDTKFSASTQHTVGSNGLYSTYNQFGGTQGNVGYLGWFHHRHGDGPRAANSDFNVFNGALKLVLDETDTVRWIVAFDGYESVSGESGRLTYAQYQADRNQSVRLNDRLWVKRYAMTVANERTLSDNTLLFVKGWGGYLDRFSRRLSGAIFNLDDQMFFSGGLDTRLQHDWRAWNNDHSLTGGFVFYAVNAPREREVTADPNATDGTAVFKLDRHTLYGSIFVENRFRFGALGVIPAARLEMIKMHAEEDFNTGLGGAPRALITDTFTAVVPLVGLGLTFDLPRNNQLYANISQGYRPPKYDDLVNPTSNTQLASPNVNEGNTWNFEFGVRGRPTTWFSYDTSLFRTDFDGLIESVGIGGGNLTRQNSGDARYQGWETSAEIELFGLAQTVTRREARPRDHQLSVFVNASLLDAKFKAGANNGNVPAYAPDYILKSGVIYRFRDRVKVALTGTMVDNHFWQDSNTAGGVGINQIAAYSVWDLTAEAKLFRDNVTVFGGINNLFDEDYYSRVRSDGIEPALQRNFYAGIKIRF